MSYRFLEHRADVKFRAWGEDLEEMFVSTMEALNETIRGDIKILEQEEKSFEIEGRDLESLLYNFLEEFLVLLEGEDFLVSRIKEIKIESRESGVVSRDWGLKCVVIGDVVENYKFTNDVKAVTYSEMFVREVVFREEQGKAGEKGWECQVVLDV